MIWRISGNILDSLVWNALSMRTDLPLPKIRSGVPPTPELIGKRAAMRSLEEIQIIDPAAEIRASMLGGISCIESSVAAPRATILYVHGGSFCMGEPVLWRGLASQIAAKGNARVIIPEYRLAPEHPYPAALHDLKRVYTTLAASVPGRLFIAGDSAGGGLALAFASTCRSGFAGIILISPWLDLTVSAGSYASNAPSDGVFSAERARIAAAAYLQGNTASDPLASPLFGDLTDMPPLLVLASQAEVLLDDTLSLIARAANASAPVRSLILPGMPHARPLLVPSANQTREVVLTIEHFIDEVPTAKSAESGS